MRVARFPPPSFYCLPGKVVSRLRSVAGAALVLANLASMATAAQAADGTASAQSELPGRAAEATGPAAVAADYQSASYSIDGTQVTLKNGVSQVEAAPGSMAQITTRYFGNELRKDLDGDGQDDVAFLLTQQTGGTGMFFYLVAALKRQGGYVGSQGFLLGDRIEPQNVISGPGRSVVVLYADHAPGQGLATPATLPKSVRLELDPQTLRFHEIAAEDAGNVEVPELSASMRRWTWLRASYSDGTAMVPRQEGRFTLTFSGKGTFTATTDCNSLSGNYEADKSKLSFGLIAATRMFCEGSQEQDFQELLAQVYGYHFTSSGELILELKVKSGTAAFR